ncbi:MAG: hypothetical protein EpisKO_30720 [Epibacterium sp.]
MGAIEKEVPADLQISSLQVRETTLLELNGSRNSAEVKRDGIFKMAVLEK